MHHLRRLGLDRKEDMFLISELNFGDYLSKQAYRQATEGLPKPADLPEDQRHGDFDVLLVHRERGVVVGEVKSVDSMAPARMVAKRLTYAAKQLGRGKKMVEHIISDLASGLPVRKTFFLPLLSRNKLTKVLETNAKLLKVSFN